MSSEIADPYGVLGISRTASPAELKQAYRRLSKAWHPDRHSGEPESQRSEADRRFKLVNAAYVAVGEILREKLQAQGVAADAAIAARSDVRVEAIRSVVASAALRVIPNMPRHTYRRIVSVVEALLLDTIAVGDRAFEFGFDLTVSEAMDFVGLGRDSRDDVIRVLDTAADDLQWRGKGADPETWQSLLQPLESVMHPPANQTAQPTHMKPDIGQRDQLLRSEPGLRATQIALSVLFLLLLLPVAPVDAIFRAVLLVGCVAAAGYVTFGVRPGR